MRIKPGSCHPSGTNTGTFECITANSGVHRANIEKRRFLRGRDISGKEDRKYLFCPIIDRITAQLCHQVIYRIFLLRDSGFRAILRPKRFGTRQSLRFFNDTFRLGESLVGFCSRCKCIIAIIRHTTGKDPILPFGQLKFNRNAFMIE